nr:hypothetical protein [Tanacetum cinerariifolium]
VDGIQRHGLRVGLPTRRRRVEAKRVVEDGAVEREVVVQWVAPAEAEPAAAGLRREARKVFLRAADSRQRPDGRRADVSSRP